MNSADTLPLGSTAALLLAHRRTAARRHCHGMPGIAQVVPLPRRQVSALPYQLVPCQN
ncbi:MAG: hypothetical protein ACLQFT_07315 [Steroidobacteraceae bacterium]